LASDFPVFWERADGVNVWDVDGNRFLDFTSAFGVTGLGHGSGPIRSALRAQAEKLLHAMGDVHPAAVKAELCEVLSRITFERWEIGRGKSILCNSGSEAVEAALKTALLHSGKPGVISFAGGYHGLGLAQDDRDAAFREPFQSQLARFAVDCHTQLFSMSVRA
jgi:4-aminobutyrate aminotransferase-like enzyme